MATEMGEYLVGAYLKLIEGCDFVDYNVRAPGGGRRGQRELDVVGVKFNGRTAFLCEVATHIRGTLYIDNPKTVDRVRKKHQYQMEYAEQHLGGFEPRFMFWSPVVPNGYLTDHLREIAKLELVINGVYKEKVRELLNRAGKDRQETQNPVFRVFQILQAMRED